jgi:dipeptidyl aminopeptidase/acylaminoacyl peptidase
MKYDLKSEKTEQVLSEKWDIMYAYHSYSGKYRVVGINEDAKNVIKIFDTKTNQVIDFPKFEEGDITSVNISQSEKWLTFYVGSSKSPANLYVYNFASKQFRKLTNSLNKEINSEDLVKGEVVRYKSFDDLDIPAILYKPQQATKDQKVPALVWVHGGPGGQSRLGYSDLIQYLVNHGYAILAVNNRGSSGYGKTFYQMDDRNHGEKDLQDCIKGKDYLATLDYIDPAKIGIFGGSYGGFMVMAALTSEPKAFEVGVNLFGVTNWLRTLKSIPPWWESFKEALYLEMGDPIKDSARLYKISPLFHANKVEKPLIVLQGSQDPRVLKVESDEIVAAVKKNKVPVEYVVFEDEGHGFVKKENQQKAYSKILEFLDKYLKKASGKPNS